MAKIILTLVFTFLMVSNLKAQKAYTPYDEIPGVNKSCKPEYNPDYPDWAKKLYQYPVNYKQINEEFNAYMRTRNGEKSAIIRYYKIWSRAVESFADQNGEIKLPDTDRYYTNLQSAQLGSGSQLKAATTYASNWTFLGPKETYWLNESGSATAPGSCPWQANVYALDVAASNNNILYCGTETGFVNKTTDKGLNWELLAQNYPFGGGITAVAIHPANPDMVYVAAGKQIHKTTNGGTSWTPMLTGVRFDADRLKIDPANPEKILAASNSGIYITTNGGVDWTRPWTTQTWDVEYKPDNSAVILAITKDAGNNFKVISSSDGGITFSILPDFPAYKNQSGALLAMTPANPNIVYASLLSGEGTETVPFIVKGTLQNGSWIWKQTKKGEYGSVGGLGGFTNGQGYFDLVLEASPKDENLLFFGTCTLWKSTDGGVNFTAIGGYRGDFKIHPDQQDLKLLPSGESWLATDGGITLTTDNFTGSTNYSARINGLVGSDFWGFDQGWNEDLMVGGRYHNGNTAMTDFYQSKALRMGGGESPTGWILQGKSRHVAFNDLGNGWILPKTASGKPEGRFIFSKFPTMDGYGSRLGNLVHHPNYSGTLYLGEGTGVWKSIDSGITYDLLYTFPDKVRYLQISYSNPGVMYIDVDNFGLFKTEDGGKTWTPKSALSSQDGRSNWKGRMFFAISPSNENSIYACYQNDAWSSANSGILHSADGGNSWTDWTGSVTGISKCLVIQPSKSGEDIVYYLTNSKNGQAAGIFLRTPGMNDWEPFNTTYPSGMQVHLALPFFRDSKIRVSGTGGIWESPLAEKDFEPIVNPWVEKQNYTCFLDTVCFDDHSVLNHDGAQWQWSISPSPDYISNQNSRNPKVVFGKPGSYTVNLTIVKNGKAYSKTIHQMVTLTTCPSVADCNNPAEIPKKDWKLVYADSEEKGDPGLATMAFDGNPETIWHTRWSSGTDPYPHELQVDMGNRYAIHKFTYLPRQLGSNGRIKNYELYLSDDKLQWGTAVATGQFVNSSAPQTISFTDPKPARYFRIKALSEINGGAWTSAAEFSVTGCNAYTAGTETPVTNQNGSAYPIPAGDQVHISLPSSSGFTYQLFSASGTLAGQGAIESSKQIHTLDMRNYKAGLYIIRLTDESGVIFRIKMIKK